MSDDGVKTPHEVGEVRTFVEFNTPNYIVSLDSNLIGDFVIVTNSSLNESLKVGLPDVNDVGVSDFHSVTCVGELPECAKKVYKVGEKMVVVTYWCMIRKIYLQTKETVEGFVSLWKR